MISLIGNHRQIPIFERSRHTTFAYFYLNSAPLGYVLANERSLVPQWLLGIFYSSGNRHPPVLCIVHRYLYRIHQEKELYNGTNTERGMDSAL